MRDADASDEAEVRRAPAFQSFEQVVMTAALVVLLGAISWGVLSRYVVATPATWVEEVASISFAWLIFVGAAEVHRRWQHVSVDLLTSLLPAAIQRPLGIAVEILVIAFCAYAAFLGAAQAYVSHSSTTSILRIPLSVSYVGLTLGFALMAFRGLQHLAQRGLRTGGAG